jgi:membrane protein implicated in regulation of membrane protease activity
MKWLIRGLYLSLLVIIVGGFFFLMYGEIPAPVAKIEKTIPIEHFKHKQSAE